MNKNLLSDKKFYFVIAIFAAAVLLLTVVASAAFGIGHNSENAASGQEGGGLAFGVNANGNTYGANEPSYSWDMRDDKAYCLGKVLKEGSTTEYIVEEVEAAYEKTTKETEETAGLITYTATFTNSVFKTQTKEVTVPKLGKHETHDGITFIEWDKMNELPTVDSAEKTGYYLKGDVEVSSAYKITGNLHLCLNGHSVKNTGTDNTYSIDDNNYTLDIYDCRHNKDCYRKYFNEDETTHAWVPTTETTNKYVDGGCLCSTNTTSNSSIIWFNKGTLNLHNINVVGNYAYEGAGIYMEGDTGKTTKANIEGCGFYGCAASCYTKETDNRGSAIFCEKNANGPESEHSLIINNCIFSSNYSMRTDNSSVCSETNGALFIGGNRCASITNSEFANNTCYSDQRYARVRGAAITVDGYGCAPANTNVTIDNCSLHDNLCEAGGDPENRQVMGAGLDVSLATINVKDTSIINNKIKLINGTKDKCAAWGGGVNICTNGEMFAVIKFDGTVNITNNFQEIDNELTGNNFTFEQSGDSENELKNSKVELGDNFSYNSKIGVNMFNWERFKFSSGQITNKYYTLYEQSAAIPAFFKDEVLDYTWVIAQNKETVAPQREVWITTHTHLFNYSIDGLEGDAPRDLICRCPEDPDFKYKCEYCEPPLTVALRGEDCKYDAKAHGVSFENLGTLKHYTNSQQIADTLTYYKKDTTTNGWTKIDSAPTDVGTYKATQQVKCQNKESEEYETLTVTSNEYSIKNNILTMFNSNGGSWADPFGGTEIITSKDVGQLVNDTFTLPSSPSKTGQLFAGWYRNTSCTGDPVTAETIVTDADAGKTYYAKWANAIVITGDKGTKYTGTGTVDVASKLASIPAGTSYVVNGNKVIFNGDETMVISATAGTNSSLAYWSTATAGEPVTSGTVTADTIFYAQFRTSKTVTAEVDATKSNGFIKEADKFPYTVPEGSTWSYNNTTKIITIKSTDGTSYTLTPVANSGNAVVKWTLAGTEVEEGEPKEITDNLTFTTYFDTAYILSFDKNGGSGGTDDTAVLSGKGLLTEIVPPTREHYTFTGYYTDAITPVQYYDKDGSLTTVGKSIKMSDTLTLKAGWELNTHTVTFDSNGHGTPPTSYSNQAFGSSFNNPGKITDATGYTHDGRWYRESSCTTEWDFAKDTMPDQDITLYAKMTANTYTVKFSANGGSGIMQNQSRTYDDGVELTANNFTKTGYTFDRWKDTNGKEFSDKTKDNITSENGATIELTAQWTANTYIVNLNANEGTPGSTTQVTATYDAAMPTLTAGELPIRVGYKFAGYYDGTASTATKYYNSDGTSAKTWDKTDTTTTLYAHWDDKTTIELDQTPQSAGYSGSVQSFAIIAKEGKTIPSDKYSIVYKQGGTEVTSPTNSGTYDVTITRPEDSTYKALDVTIDKGLVINKRDLTVTPETGQSKMYGNADPAVFTYEYSGNVPGETPAFTGKLSRVAGETVAKSPYKITQGDLALAENDSFLPVNYTLKFNDTVTFVIMKRDVVFTGETKEKAYTGEPIEITGITISGTGLVTGHTHDVTYSATGTDQGIYPGTITAANDVKIYDSTNAEVQDNYEITTTPGKLIISNKIEVTVTGITADSRTYDGTTNVALNCTKATVTGQTAGDEVNVQSATGALSDKNAGNGKTVTISNIVLGGKDAKKYLVSDASQKETVVDITKVNLLTTPTDGQSKIYREDDPPLTHDSPASPVAGETPAYSGSLVRTSGENAGTYPINAGTLALIDNGTFLANNYTLTVQTDVLFTINAKSISSEQITISEIEESVYNGQPQTPQPTIIDTKNPATELVLNSDYTLTYTDNKNAGTATVVITCKGNYQGTKTITFVINKAKAQVCAEDASKTAGEEDPQLTATVTGTFGSDTIEYTVSREVGEDAGTYTITPTGNAEQPNYTVTYKNGTFTINPASIVETVLSSGATGDAATPLIALLSFVFVASLVSLFSLRKLAQRN